LLIEVLEEGRQADAVRGEGSHSAETRLQTHNPYRPPCTRRGELTIVRLTVITEEGRSLAPVGFPGIVTPPPPAATEAGQDTLTHHRAV
jgi:hypothetical protein